MVFFNYALRKLNAKIVYYGPGLCGKTTNLQWIHDNFEGGDKGKMVSLATEGDRTIFFDLLPLDIGTIRGMDVTLQLYTVPGQVHYNSTRQLVLRGADGVVFVADSQRAMHGSNSESLENLEENLALQGVTLSEFPHVLQFNKRDLGDVMPVEEMDSMLNRYGSPFFEAVAVEGIGVQDTLEGIVRLVMRSLKDRYESRGPGVKPADSATPGPVPAVEETPAAGSGSASVIRPLSGGPPPSAPPVTPSFDIERDPEPVSIDEPEAPESEGFEPGAGVPAFDDPGPAFAPPDSPAGEAVDSGSTPFEDADTQTGILVPAIDEESETPVSEERVSPDQPPEGPGDLFEGDDDHTSVGRYDTADFEECDELQPGGDEGETPKDLEEIDAFRDEHPAGVSDTVEEPEPAVGEGAESDGYDVDGTTAAVDDLVASVLGSGVDRAESFPAAPPAGISDTDHRTSECSDEAEETEAVPDQSETEVFEAHGDVSPAEEEESRSDSEQSEVDVAAAAAEESPETAAEQPPEAPAYPAVGTPIIFDDADPFGQPPREDEPVPEIVRPFSAELVPQRDETPVTVTAGDNSLALKLTGTGAIVESGQVRALDIEVPVPGNWVGNRRVTLQLRLTLSPVTEDEDEGTTGPA